MEGEAFAEQESGFHKHRIADLDIAWADKLEDIGLELGLVRRLQMEHFQLDQDRIPSEVADRATALAFRRKVILETLTELVRVRVGVLRGHWATSLAKFDCMGLHKPRLVYRRLFD